MADPKGQIRSVDELNPQFALLVKKWLEIMEQQGYGIKIIETRRSLAVAEAYFAQGRRSFGEINTLRENAGLTLIGSREASRIITKAHPWESWHVYGLAMDVVPVVDGKLDWEYTPDDPKDHYRAMAKAAVTLGMQWGGFWRTFRDYPHLEYHPGVTLEAAREWMETNHSWRVPIMAGKDS